ncbi:hypothetical protein RN001_015089 [Aquatica leii]|uniref:Uncharacterized protein n=1 Tax=Aquatica leii TaxID=1421715 RepID=A0AAN7SND8_9COLE|nr:hypothetical protein RN001_015089 [Aquatica leii]
MHNVCKINSLNHVEITEDYNLVYNNVPEEIEILKFPCHTQAVERCIKLVTEASSLVCGAEARDGFIRARISSRTAMPKFNTKSEFFKTL